MLQHWNVFVICTICFFVAHGIGLYKQSLKVNRMKPYTCTEYRQEMILLGLQRQLADPLLEPPERARIEEQIRKIEKEMDMQ